MGERAAILAATVALVGWAYLVQSATLSMNISLATLNQSRHEVPPLLSTFGTTQTNHHSNQSDTSSALDSTSYIGHMLDTNVDLNPTGEPIAVVPTYVEERTTEGITLAPEEVKSDVAMVRTINNPSEEPSKVEPTDGHQDITEEVLIPMELRAIPLEHPSREPSMVAPTDVNELFKSETIAMEPKSPKVEVAVIPIDKSSVEPSMIAPTNVNQTIAADKRTSEAIAMVPRSVKVEIDAIPIVKSSGEASTVAPTDVNKQTTEDKLFNEPTVASRAVNTEATTTVNKPSGEPSMTTTTKVHPGTTADNITDIITVSSGAIKTETTAMPCGKLSSDEHRTVTSPGVDVEMSKDKTSGAGITLDPKTVNVEDTITSKHKIIGSLTTMKPNADKVIVMEKSNTSVAGTPTGDKPVPSANTTEGKLAGESSKVQLFILQIEDIDEPHGNGTGCNVTSLTIHKNNTRKQDKHISKIKPNVITKKASKRRGASRSEPNELENEYETNERLEGERPVNRRAGNEGKNRGTSGQDPDAVNEEEEDDEIWENEDDQLEEEPPVEPVNEKSDSNAERDEEEEEEVDDEVTNEDEPFEEDRNEDVDEDERVGNAVQSAENSEGTSKGKTSGDDTYVNLSKWRPLQPRPDRVKLIKNKYGST